MAVHQLKFFSRTLSTGLFIIVWDNQVKVFYISRGRLPWPDVSRGGQIIPTISIKSRNLLHFSRNSLPLYISRGTKPYQDNISRGNKPYHRNISRGNIPVWYTFENTQYQQMQPMWFCIFSNRWFEETFEKTQRRTAKQMQPIWLWLFSSRTFKDTFEKNTVEKSHIAVCLFVYFHDLLHIIIQALFEDPFENTRVEKYLINVIVVTLYPLIQPFWKHIWQHTVEKVQQI